MASQLTQFHLYEYFIDGACTHKLLVRVSRPSYSNADQGAEDAAEDFAYSAADRLRGWWERWLLQRDCPLKHQSQLMHITYDTMTGVLDDDLGLRRLRLWIADVDGGPVLGLADTEQEFLAQLHDYTSPVSTTRLESNVTSHDVYFLTERDGEGDLRGA